MSSRQASDSVSVSERWHFSFAGLMLLLFGIFAALYALSKSRERAYMQEVAELRQQLEVERKRALPPAAASRTDGNVEDPLAVQSNEALTAEFQRGVAGLQALIRGASAREKWIETEALPGGGMLLRVIASDLYEVGDPRVSAIQSRLLDVLGEAIRRTGRSIRIEAYADGQDSERLAQGGDGKVIRSSWDLSALRSAWIAQYWMRRFDFDPARMEVVALGRSSGKRRIEVIIERQRN